MNSIVLGIDIGGTELKIGRVENGLIVEQIFRTVDTKATKEETLSSLFEAIDSTINSEVTAIGIGVPAVVDPVTGIVYDVQNIPSWKEVELKELVEQRYKLPVFINNDANCFALGEKIYGKGKHYENFIGLSIGTGIGMGIIINGRLYNGVLCGAGEIGMLNYKDGIMEDYSSGHFFTSIYKSSAKELSQNAAEGNETALKSFNEFGFHLGECLKAILYTYAPEAIILGGSISKAFPYFKKTMELSLQSFAYQKQIQNLKIETSNYEGIAILGAASLCLQE
ncbi:MAG: ROK family protein [Flavobacterium sp.]|uniref:ROK family protein n=1 Tax=Flavobacterium sp. TaxID=239 RepID=UPI0026236723|nr:ROK family protein [Flavobacterium sp.]MDD5148970.1 ROK family protein [Flavobacterium sp.]